MSLFTPIEAQEGEKIVKEFVTYDKSFVARASLASDKIKAYYKELKEEILSYKGARSRISWQYDSFSYKRKKIAVLTIRGNTLSLYLALDINNYPDAKYKLVDESTKKSYIETPLKLKITGSRTLNYAKELIKDLFNDDVIYKAYRLHKFKNDFAYRDIETLLALDLVKKKYHKKRIKLDSGKIKVKIYAIVLPNVKNISLYLVGNLENLGAWDPAKALKMKRVYDNFYELELDLMPSHFEFKIIVSQDFKFVEKGIWSEEIVNHHYDAKGNMLVEDIIHHLHYEGELK